MHPLCSMIHYCVPYQCLYRSRIDFMHFMHFMHLMHFRRTHHNIIPWLLDQKVVFNVRNWADYLVCTCIRMMFGTSQILFNIILATCKQIIISGHDWTRWRHHWRTVLKFKRSQTRDSFSRPAPKAGKSEIIKGAPTGKVNQTTTNLVDPCKQFPVLYVITGKALDI